MIVEKALERSFAIVDRTLRNSFPDDYHKRCMYAAFGLQALLHDLGVEAEVVGGDMLTFVVSRSGQQAGMQGFGNARDGFAHYWVEAGGYLVDIGPHYLPLGSSFPAEAVPLIAWRRTEPLPPFLRYRTLENFGAGPVMMSDRIIEERKCAFVKLCLSRLGSQVGQPKLPHWVLTGISSLADRGKKGDPWVLGAVRFATMRGAVADLPF